MTNGNAHLLINDLFASQISGLSHPHPHTSLLNFTLLKITHCMRITLVIFHIHLLTAVLSLDGSFSFILFLFSILLTNMFSAKWPLPLIQKIQHALLFKWPLLLKDSWFHRLKYFVSYFTHKSSIPIREVISNPLDTIQSVCTRKKQGKRKNI